MKRFSFQFEFIYFFVAGKGDGGFEGNVALPETRSVSGGEGLRSEGWSG